MTRMDGKFHEYVFFAYFMVMTPLIVAARFAGFSLVFLEELFWPMVAAAAVVLSLTAGKIEFPRRMLLLVFCFAAMMSIKAVVGYLAPHEYFGANGYLIEFKFILFFLISLIICTAAPVIDTGKIQKYFLFFAIVEIVLWIIQVKIGGARTSDVLSEQNYDGFLILIGYVLVLKEEKISWPKYALLFFATYCTSSRTGLLSFLVLSFVRLRNMKNKFLFISLVAAMAAVAIIVFIRKLGSLKLESVDRLVMLLQFKDQLLRFGPREYLWGTIPGVPLTLKNQAMNYYIERQSVPLGLYGLHPFNFHGFLMRFMMSYGPLAFIFLGSGLFKEALKERWKLYLILLIATQMFSLSVFYLTVMAAPLWLLMFTRSQGEEIAVSPIGTARA